MASFAWGLVTLVAIVVGFDFLLWKPLVAWVSRFRGGELSSEEGGDSTIADLWPGLRLPRWTRDLWRRFVRRRWEMWSKARADKAASVRSPVLHEGHKENFSQEAPRVSPGLDLRGSKANPWVDQLIFSPLGQVMRSSQTIFGKPAKGIVPRIFKGWGQWILSFAAGGLVFYLLPRLPAVGSVLGRVESAQWLGLTQALLMTGIKVFGVLLFATAWTVPFGIWVAKRPAWNKFMQPLIQNLAAFPTPVLFPLLALTMVQWGLPAGLIAMILMTIGNQWYLLFNVLSGASKISGELLEVAQLHGLSRWGRFRFVYLPTIFPSLLTGWITAAGGAWNASIVAELVHYPGGELRAEGIGAEITQATVSGQYVHLVAAVIVITIALVVVNRTLWRNMHQYAARLT
jgi:NitT/TauT family transport system permease protein